MSDSIGITEAAMKTVRQKWGLTDMPRFWEDRMKEVLDEYRRLLGSGSPEVLEELEVNAILHLPDPLDGSVQ